MGDYDPLSLPAPAFDRPPTAEYQPPLETSPALPNLRRTDAAQVARRADGLSEEQILDSVFGGGGAGQPKPFKHPGTVRIPGPLMPASGTANPGQPAPGGAQPGQGQQYAQPGGTDAFRSALMQQGMGALDQGITSRENRAIQEAARARSTNMGRTFDQTASIKEAEAVIAEDNARRMQNRAFAQSALGQ